ncbi:DUF21 domain-containing protein [Patescibacteria group bacterium]|nr:DUF21 domain-containing protein [Patescibacteria group bacterium]
MSALFSGLTLGLLSLSTSHLQRKISLGDERAKKIYQVRRNGNYLLCTLLLGNVAVNAAISIFLTSIASGVVAMFVATGLIVVFGEIIPQATVYRHALNVGARTVWLVRIFQIILWPVAWPLARGLDWILGKELPTIWSKKEIEQLVEFHEDHPQSAIDEDEERIIKGALQYSDTTAKQVMTQKENVFALEKSVILNDRLLRKIMVKGFTRIPVYKNDIGNIIGILYTKQLIGVDQGTPLKEVFRKRETVKVSEDIKLDALLNKLVKRRTHLAFVYNQKDELVGIATLEDIIEEILKREIVDEYDTPLRKKNVILVL